MTRGARISLITVGVVAVLLVAGNVLFVRSDERQAAAFRFAVGEPEAALERISQAAESKGTLAGSGTGVTIPSRNLANLGATQWTISADGVIRGIAPERGLVVLLTPEMKEKKVSWNCRLEPERAFMRGTCMFIGQRNR